MIYRCAIDGACKNNGTPQCRSVGAAYIQSIIEHDTTCRNHRVVTQCESTESSNQRGELLGLICLFRELARTCSLTESDTVLVITDSEYIFNTMSKGWYNSWRYNFWLTSTGTEVKNKHLWKLIIELYESIPSDVVFYHIKGHIIPIGAVTATNLVHQDNSGKLLFDHCLAKYSESVTSSAGKKRLSHAEELFETNNGFVAPYDLLNTLAAMNATVDNFAKYTLDKTLS